MLLDTKSIIFICYLFTFVTVIMGSLFSRTVSDTQIQILNYSFSELFVIDAIATSMIVLGGLVLVAPQSKYGRYSTTSGFMIPARIAWFIQESPSLLVPLYILYKTEGRYFSNVVNKILLGQFLFHYFQRTFVFSYLVRGGKPSPLRIVLSAILFCACNGYVQARFITQFAEYPQNWITSPRFLLGCSLYVTGLIINLHSDHILRTLRKPEETGYKIPYGGLFEYVSAANYFGEIVEWAGYALASWSYPSFAFACSTLGILGIRGYQHHKHNNDSSTDIANTVRCITNTSAEIICIFDESMKLHLHQKLAKMDYQKKFENYPRHRKGVIPFIF